MRLFIAAPISRQVQDKIAALIDDLRAAGADYKWVEPENLHLTLCFLGETPDEKIPAIEKALGVAARGRTAFELGLTELGAFSSLEHPRVIWIGGRAGAPELCAVAAAIDQALRREGIFPKEPAREFKPHLTLGRLRGPRNFSKLTDRIKILPKLIFSSNIDRLVLYRSRLSASGPRYSVICEGLLDARP